MTIFQLKQLIKHILTLLLGAILCIEFSNALAQEGQDSFQKMLPLNMGPQLFFDAQTTEFSKDGRNQVFKGDVVAVGGGVMITADKISMDRKTFKMNAEGHVIILTVNQVFLGDKVSYNTATGDFLLINSVMVANDEAVTQKIGRQVLGFTPAEVAFNEQIIKRMADIEARKNTIREEYLESSDYGALQPSENMIDKYSLLLEQEDLINKQENPFLARMTKDRRNRYKKRREHWEKGIKDAVTLQKNRRITSFFRINGKKLTRANENDYEAEDAFWTPCKCDEDENPAWGLRSSGLKGQMEGYIDFYHPVLEVKGVPVLYLPYLKVPIKEKRQSGFLMPTFGYRSVSGNIYAQPIYFALGDSYDATLSPEIYERRGTKLGIEGRYKQRKNSGWTLNLEVIRDRLWIDEKNRREQAQDYYFANSDEELINKCEAELGGDASSVNPNKLQQCIRKSRRHLRVPENTWRGAQVWKGMTLLAPRLSFVSQGRIYSDHRYIEDLTLYEDTELQNSLDARNGATQFSTTKYITHLDAKNFYLGMGGSFGDSVLSEERFQGQQLPFVADVQSRMYSLDRGMGVLPVYAQIKGAHRQIADFVGDGENKPQIDGQNKTLGSGYWQRVEVNEVSPLLSHGIVKVDQFLDWESRHIYHNKLSETDSNIESMKTGFTLNLPIDGDSELPSFFQPADGFGRRNIRHYMNWAITFSVRPYIRRNGPYGERKYFKEENNGDFAESGDLVYFASDRREAVKEDNDDIAREDMMITHKQIKFATSHTWDLYDRGWERVKGAVKSEEATAFEKLTFNERAKRELLFSLDRPVEGFSDMYDEESKEWFINRYQLVERNKKRVVTMDSGSSYDFETAERRELARNDDSQNIDNFEPWSDPYLNTSIIAFDTKLANKVRYNIYFKKISKQEFSLQLPKFLQSSLSFKYTIGNEYTRNQDTGSVNTIRTQERRAKLTSSLLPHFALSANLGRRSRDVSKVEESKKEKERSAYTTIFSATYISPSDCWKLAFQREKAYGKDERNAQYLLKLFVLFMGRARGSPPLQPGLEREFRSDRAD